MLIVRVGDIYLNWGRGLQTIRRGSIGSSGSFFGCYLCLRSAASIAVDFCQKIELVCLLWKPVISIHNHPGVCLPGRPL